MPALHEPRKFLMRKGRWQRVFGVKIVNAMGYGVKLECQGDAEIAKDAEGREGKVER
jgi:hypothetical protein